MVLNKYREFTGINILFAFSAFLVTPLLAPYLETIGFASWQISLMSAAFAFGIVCLGPFIGEIAASVGRRLVIIVGLWAGVVSIALYLLTDAWFTIALARLFDAVALSFVSLLLLSKIEDTISDKNRGRVTGISLSLIYVGHMLGPLAGAALAEKFSIAAPFILSAVIMLCISIFLLFQKTEHLHNPSLPLAKLSWLEEVKTFLTHKELRGVAIMGVAMHSALPLHHIFLPLLIVENLGLSFESIGIALFAHGVPFIFQGFMGTLADKYSFWRMILAGAAIAAGAVFGLSFVDSFAVLVVMVLILALGDSLWNVSAISLMSDIGERGKTEARVLTTYSSIAKIGTLISFLLSAVVVKLWGLQSVFMMHAFFILVGCFISFRYLRPEKEIGRAIITNAEII